MVCSQCRAGELLCSRNDLSMVYVLTHSLFEENMLLQRAEEEKSGISQSDQILKKSSQSKEAEILRLCRDASYAECLEMRQLLRSKPAANSALEWIQRVAELDRTLSQKGAQTVFFVGPVRTR